MMKKMLALTVVSLLLVACGMTDDQEVSSDAIDESVTSANNQLGFEVLRKVEPDDDGNRFISPTSLFMALSMVYNGADGETKEEIADTLQLEGIDVDDLNQANASLMALINDDSRDVELKIGNSIWLNDQFQFQADFADKNRNYFNAEIEEIDVADDDSVERINDWVKEATNETIDQIVEAPLDPYMVSLLVNAIYFHGAWTYAFDENQTIDREFYLEDGSAVEVPLMYLSEELMYMETDDFQAVSLPYGEDEDMNMKIFLPNDMTDFQDNLTNDHWEQWKDEFEQQEGTVMLPRFDLEYEASLNETLKTLGMTTAFDENEANFDKMIEEDDPIWISEIKQKTFLDVNEEGTEAAGVTSVEFETTSLPVDDERFEMIVDRPFFIVITDEETGLFLFMGAIQKP